jgi:RNA polymerase sigma-32 factor
MDIAISNLFSADYSTYVRQVRSYPLLTKEEEFKLTTAVFNNSDKNAINTLVLSNLRFVVWIARKYKGYNLDLHDLIQEGNIGLLKSISKFDPYKGVRFAAYAVYWIKAQIHEFLMNNYHIIKISSSRANRKLFFKLKSRVANEQSTSMWLSHDDITTLSSEFGVSPSDIREMEGRLRYHDVSAFQPISDKDEESFNVEIAADTEDHVANITNSTISDRISEYLATIKPRSRYIIEQRWLTDSPKTFKELASELNVSEQRIQQVEKLELGKLKDHVVSLNLYP